MSSIFTRRGAMALGGAGAALAGLAAWFSPAHEAKQGTGSRPAVERGHWARVRDSFHLEPGFVHLAGMLLAMHPKPVREAIERHRRELDKNPAAYVNSNKTRFEAEIRRAAGRYLGAEPSDLVLTDSTTMGIGLVYNGISIRADQEILTSVHDYHATHDAIALKAARSGAAVRAITLYDDSAQARADDVVARLAAEIRPETRIIALTWVHSSNGVKLPIKAISAAVARTNENRADEDRALLCVDGVHALGVENFQVADLGCDFLMAGTHKWLCGPRGTGIVWGRPEAQRALSATIPSFTRGSGWGGEVSPGGFHSFEHRWALGAAFDWHAELGRAAVAQRISGLASRYKAELAYMKHVTLRTPIDPAMSAGIVAFDVQGLSSGEVETRLRSEGILATRAPYNPSHARFAPGLLNLASEIAPTIAAVRRLS